MVDAHLSSKRKRQKSLEGEDSDTSCSSGKTSSEILSDVDEKAEKDTDDCQFVFSHKKKEQIMGYGLKAGNSTAARSKEISYPSVPPIEKGMTPAERKQRRKIRNRISAQQHRERHREYIGTLNELIEKQIKEIDELTNKIDSFNKEHDKELEDIKEKYASALKEIEVMKNCIILQYRANGFDSRGTSLCSCVSEEFAMYNDEFLDGMMNLGGELVASPLHPTVVADGTTAVAPVCFNIDSDIQDNYETISEVLKHSGDRMSESSADVANTRFDCDGSYPLSFWESRGNVENVGTDVEAATPPMECIGRQSPKMCSVTATSSAVIEPSMEHQRSWLRSTVPLYLLGVATLGLICFSGTLTNSNTQGFVEKSETTPVRRLNHIYELLMGVVEKDREDDVFNWKSYAMKDASRHQYVTPPWRYSDFINLYEDTKIQQIINFVKLKLSSEKEGQSKGVVVHDQQWRGHLTSAGTSDAPKVSYLYISANNTSSVEGSMSTDLAMHTLSKPSSSSVTHRVRDTTNNRKTKELVLRDEQEKHSGLYGFLSRAFFSEEPGSSMEENNGFVFNADTHHLVLLVPMASILWRGTNEDLVNSWMGNNTQSQYLEISCLVENVRSLHTKGFSIM